MKTNCFLIDKIRFSCWKSQNGWDDPFYSSRGLKWRQEGGKLDECLLKVKEGPRTIRPTQSLCRWCLCYMCRDGLSSNFEFEILFIDIAKIMENVSYRSFIRHLSSLEYWNLLSQSHCLWLLLMLHSCKVFLPRVQYYNRFYMLAYDLGDDWSI